MFNYSELKRIALKIDTRAYLDYNKFPEDDCPNLTYSERQIISNKPTPEEIKNEERIAETIRKFVNRNEK